MDNITKFLHALFKKCGTYKIKQFVWNREFAVGKWEYLSDSKTDFVYNYIENHTRNGDILDLGCGDGYTAWELDNNKYSFYVGVDISSKAIENAKNNASKSVTFNGKTSYHVGDIANYVPERRFNVILFRESIYYIKYSAIIKTLVKLRHYLCEDGVFIVRVCDPRRHKKIINLISKNFGNLEHIKSETGTGVILIFK